VSHFREKDTFLLAKVKYILDLKLLPAAADIIDKIELHMATGDNNNP
jgi:hypothetical protein